ncbi:MAG: hypothetical protein CMJ83_04305 [Planctomycetes bacterium]|nr:hypothetical protein [Planctomycetota bacterium]
MREEIEWFCRHGVSDIAVLDPIFNANQAHAAWVLEELSRNDYAGRLSLQCRAEFVTDEFIAAAQRLDVRLEFGLQTIHRSEGNAVRRLNNLARVSKALDSARRAGLAHEVSLIFGLPGQTLASFEASVDWCLEHNVPVLKAFPLLLLRGTELELERERWGLRLDARSTMPMVVSSNTFARREWQQMQRLSEALRRTEGAHPTSVDALRRIADASLPDASRWSPTTSGEARAQ